MLRSMGREAAFIARKMRAKHGRGFRAMACPMAIGDALAVDVASDGKRVYALIQAPIQVSMQAAQSKKAGLYRSDDGGENWTLANQ